MLKMKEYNVRLTENELKNLKIFLSRVPLTGNEALGFVNIANKINNAELVEKSK